MKKLILFIAIIFIWCAITKADVVIKRKTIADMAGLMTMETNISEIIKNDKSRSIVSSKMTGGTMVKLGGKESTATILITRIDKGISYGIDPVKKIYSELPLSSMKELFATSESQSSKNDNSEYIWTTDVKAMDQMRKVNGFDCKNIVGNAVGVKKYNVKDSAFITYEMCLADDIAGKTEIEQYQKKYSDALGIDEIWSENNLGWAMKDYGPQIEVLNRKIRSAGGYPIKTIVDIESNFNPAGDMDGNPNDVKLSQDGRHKILSMITEVLSIEQKPADDAQFEVPAGYKKK